MASSGTPGVWPRIPVAFSIPEDNRAARDALRKQLRWRGFGAYALVTMCIGGGQGTAAIFEPM